MKTGVKGFNSHSAKESLLKHRRGPGLVGAEMGPGSLEPASGGRRLRGAKVCGDSAGVARETPQGQAPFNSDVGGCTG